VCLCQFAVLSITLLFSAAVDILTEFLHVMLHGILFTRDIYPQGAFERRKMYDVPVQVWMHFKSAEFLLHCIALIAYLFIHSLNMPHESTIIMRSFHK